MTPPFRVLITGGTGLLGKSLLESDPSGWEILATRHTNRPPAEWAGSFHPLDVRDADAVGRLLRELQPDAVIHTASIGSVDEAERDPVGARAVNVEGTRNVAQACKRQKAFLVQISSNAVFDGLNPPYSEESPTGPANLYGRIKLEAEAAVREAGGPHLIVRPILMYGWPWPDGRGNIVTRWLEALEAGHPVPVDDRIFSMPLSVEDCAKTIRTALEKKMTGTLHVAGPERLSLVEFSKAVARIFGYPQTSIEPIPAEVLARLAPRPKDTSFLTRRLSEELGIRPMDVEKGLTRMKERRGAEVAK